MIDSLLSAADPARDLVPDCDRADAQAMLREITSTARRLSRRPRPGGRTGRLVVSGAAAAAAAVAVVLALPDHTDPRYSSAAYTVDSRSDGSVRVVLRWNELHDVRKLQGALDRAHARTVILTGDAVVGRRAVPSIPPCARYRSGGYSAHAVQWDFANPRTEVNGVVIRPHYFPKDGTFVIEVTYVPGTREMTGTLSFMARGRVPTCIQPAVVPSDAGPTAGPTAVRHTS